MPVEGMSVMDERIRSVIRLKDGEVRYFERKAQAKWVPRSAEFLMGILQS